MAQTPVETAAPPRTSGSSGLVLLGTAIAVLVAAGLTALSGARPLVALGLPDPGVLTTVGLPAVRAVAEVAMVLTIGALLLAAFLAPPQKSGYLDVAGYRALRTAGWTAALWVVAAVLLVPLTVADALGRPVADVLDVGLLLEVVPQLAASTAWSWTAVIAALVVVGCRSVLTWGWTAVLFGLSVAGPLPVTLTGHSAAGGSHDIATDSLVLHVLASSLWVGGLVAVIALAASRGPDRAAALATAVPRFSALALVCWLVLAVTGTINALTRISPGAVFGSYYGGLLLAKAGALLALGALGALHRRSTVGAASRGEPRALLRLGGVEVLLMLATIGLAVALGRTAAPDDGSGAPSRAEALIGYDLDGPPTLARLLFDWRFDLIFGSAAIVLAVVYLIGVRRMRARGDDWPVGRTLGWLAGCATLLIATSSGIGRYGPAMFSVHMGEHMILSMLVPILLVLGAPVTLALRTLPSGGRHGPPGPREWLLAAVHSPPSRWLTHPLVALPLFVGSYYALYFSGIFPAALPEHGAHLLMNLHFLVVGTLFFWPIIGIDPSPRRLPPVARLAVVFASVPFHAFFGVALMSSATVIGGDFYRALALPWVPDLLQDQRLGGGLAWASGELPLLLVVIALLIQWSRHDERSARRDDRRAEHDGDADLRAYNAMLHRLATETRPSVAQSDETESSPGHTDRGGVGAEDDSRAVRTTGGTAVSAGHGAEAAPSEPPDAPR
ncbi:bifunctional copper resistance protein CopD/cytochrome c oxidase assembly protein [Pseudonocardia sp. KRD-184]|uniref:Bifunctional copper resistance protein CopD/cytochrome c oxidase assembly protein n=1 Tax=Pseudonocardia oceani TaxID=2792013 RepID=A0ABS6UEG4_9PSEU|nr:cytochrome c oxidase assembly protein [Pseudonocardia oceani]MBW0093453.1 bifunctional copper resistance protein CopD/cytochrome c oxidase assembly protein [Pseudonocardia oceani]MBW0096534.1 bifunctional copper resistance protein CopD/cytochrome c oxidase assembly protein [Pseudonocardia oceani]MBW0109284.1 bifunctional copper resistance protein CopD/cytochrome c oxidase assembly protein [Pseudonocardia oceani]MBW0123380.1 bifunctional copper resistance protein CopD/cytochrome c oxidase ass